MRDLKSFEAWKDLTNYFGIYQISNLGNIRSLDRIITRKDGKKPFKRGKILKPSLNTKGYAQVRLQGGKIFRVHRLVALEFISNPFNFPQINHKNGLKTDNCVSNLEWCNNSQNQLHAYKNNFQVKKFGVNNPNHKTKKLNSSL